MSVEFAILGPLESHRDGRPVVLGAAKQRALLALLLIHANRVVSVDTMVDDLWGAEPPTRAVNAVRVYVSALRRALEPDRSARMPSELIVTRPPGYLLRVGDDELDLRRAETLIDRGRRSADAGDADAAADAYRNALGLWRGPALAEFAYEPFAEREAARLEELRLHITEERVEADLGTGRHGDLVGELESLVAGEGLRERFTAQLMLALYRCGRQAEALRAYQRLRTRLGEELGIEPTAAVQALEEAIVLQKPELDWVGPTGNGDRRYFDAGAGVAPQRLASDGHVAPPPQPLITPEGSVFIGRQAELARLRDAWRRVVTGQRHVVLVAGEPGIGKTRLAAELATLASAESAIVLYGRCDAEGAIPYQPLVEALRHYVMTADPLVVRDQLGPLGGELARVLPHLGQTVAGLPPPLQADPDTERYRLFEAVAHLLSHASSATPMLLVVDDLHWADKPTLALLRHVVRSPEPMSLLVLGTYRDTELDGSASIALIIPDLRRDASVERIELGGLTGAEVSALVEAAAGHPLGPDGHALAETVGADAGGNPFFVAEVLRHLAESGALARRDGRWAMTRAPFDLGVPEGVHEVVAQRLARLEQQTNNVLETAAVIGPEFNLTTLVDASDAAEGDVVRGLERAERARLTVADPGRPGVFLFAHALVRAAIYDGLAESRRLHLHRQVGLVLERRATPGTRTNELAHHFGQAAALGEGERAVAYARRAGDEARAQLAFEEAAALYQRALDASALVEHFDPAVECDLQIALADALRRSGDERYRDTVLAAAAGARSLGDPTRFAEAVLVRRWFGLTSEVGTAEPALGALIDEALEQAGPADSPYRCRLLALLASERAWNAPDWERTMALSREAVAMARRLDDPPTLVQAIEASIFVDAGPDRLESRLAMSKELISVGTAVGDVEAVWVGHGQLEQLLLETGDYPASTAELERLARVADEVRSPAAAWSLGFRRAARAAMAGALDEAERIAVRTYELGQQHGVHGSWLRGALAQLIGMVRHEQGRIEEFEALMSASAEAFAAIPSARAMLAMLYAETDRAEQAEEQLKRLTVGGALALPLDQLWAGGMTMLSVAVALLGDTDRAGALYGILVPYEERVASVGGAHVGPLHRPLGLLAAALGRHTEADRHFAAAVRTCDQMDAPGWLARVRCEWGNALLQRGGDGDRDRGRALLADGLVAAEQIGMARVAAAARGLLAVPN